MRCNNCGKELLDLYDGTLFCQHCQREINVKQFVDDADKEDFELGEVLFHEALQADSEKRRDKMSQAVGYTARAAFSGNPKAMLRLAYMYECGLGDVETQDDAIAVRMACKYYGMVWRGTSAKSSTQLRNLRTIAAKRHLNLLMFVYTKKKTLENRLKQYPECSRNIQNVIKAYVSSGEFNDPGVNILDGQAESFSAKDINGVLNSCIVAGIRAPLFGVIYASGSEVKAWAKANFNNRSRSFDFVVLCNNTEEYTTVKNPDRFDELKNNDVCCLGYLYRVGGFGRALRKKIPWDSILSKARDNERSYVFYADDIRRYKHHRTLAGAVREFGEKFLNKETHEKFQW